MNPVTLQSLTVDELEDYAQTLGFTTRSAKTKEAKIKFISKKYERIQPITVLGIELEIPVKRRMSSNFIELIEKSERSRDDVVEAFTYLLGEKQHQTLVEVATDDDGTIDDAALAFAYNAIIYNGDLKKY